jgi:TRAP-type C4-dicarboxylate transport system permease large subunit
VTFLAGVVTGVVGLLGLELVVWLWLTRHRYDAPEEGD